MTSMAHSHRCFEISRCTCIHAKLALHRDTCSVESPSDSSGWDVKGNGDLSGRELLSRHEQEDLSIPLRQRGHRRM